jgi:hypothetical protein
MVEPRLSNGYYEDTRERRTSYEEAASLDGEDPRDLPIQGPAHRRRFTDHDISELLLTPMRLGDVAHSVDRLCDLLAPAFAPFVWDTVGLVDAAGTVSGAGGFVKVFPAVGGTGAVLRGIVIGGAAAGIYQLIACRNAIVLVGGPGQRVVKPVRLTAQVLTITLGGELTLAPDENLFLFQTAANNNVDFSAEYRLRRSE